MRREELEHVLRAASRVIEERDLLVIGSAAILGSYAEELLPVEATRSDDADLAPFDDPNGEKATRIEGAIGELSPFHQTNGYYGQGVSVGTAVLPTGWRDRLVAYENDNTDPGRGLCLEPHDLVVSKLIAFRPKDTEFAAALLVHGLVDANLVLARLGAVEDLDPARRIRIEEWLLEQAHAPRMNP